VSAETRFRIALGCFTLAALCIIGWVWSIADAYTPDQVIDATRARLAVDFWEWPLASAVFYLLGYLFLPKEDVP
jgi:hypothetical protein